MLKKMPIVLIFLIFGTIFAFPYLPLTGLRFLFFLSSFTKSVIVFLLPFIVFSLIFKSVLAFAKQGRSFIVVIVCSLCFSNFLSTFLSHFVGKWVYSHPLRLITPHGVQALDPLWSFSFPKLFSNDIAMALGAIFGLLGAFFFIDHSKRLAECLAVIVQKLLKCIMVFIPILVIGSVVKLQYDGMVGVVLNDYSFVFVTIAITQFSYILLVYFVANQFNRVDCISHLKSMIPAGISGFSTMSSAVTIPLTLQGVLSHTKNPDVVNAVIPTTVNIHLVGDCLAIPILAYAILKSFGLPDPSFFSYLTFSLYFVWAKFCVAAVPGGGILVMIPILESYLGFQGEMTVLITALYILFDPVITCVNVLGNGAFAKLMDQLYVKVLSLKEKF